MGENSKMTTARTPEMDGALSWLVFFSSFMVTFITVGQLQSFGIYFVTFSEYFRIDMKTTGLIGGVCFTMANITGPVAGVLQKRYGARLVIMTGGMISTLGMISAYFARDFWHLYISYGLLVGLGYGLSINPSVSILPEYFQKHRYLVTTLLSISTSLGALTIAPFTLFQIETFTWRGSMLINAGLCMQLLIFGSLIKSRSIDTRASIRVLLNFKVFKDPCYVLILADGIFFGGGGFVIMSTVSSFAMSRGLSAWESATLISVISASTTVSRILAVFLSSIKRLDRLTVYSLATLLACTGVLGCVFAYDFWTFSIALFVFGFSGGVKFAQLANVIIDLVGVEALAVALGYFMFTLGLGGFILPWVAGWIADTTETANAWIFVFVALMIGFVCCCIVLILRRRRNQKSPHVENDAKDVDEIVGLAIATE